MSLPQRFVLASSRPETSSSSVNALQAPCTMHSLRETRFVAQQTQPSERCVHYERSYGAMASAPAHGPEF